MIVRTKAKVASRTYADDKDTGRHVEGKTEHGEGHAPYDWDKSVRLGVVKAAHGIKLVYGFQSAGVDVGIELPWPMGSKADVKLGYMEAFQIIDDVLSERAKELDPLLRELAKKYHHR